MESDTKSSPRNHDVDVNTSPTFRKLTSDAGSRKYRRRSPVGGSSSSDEIPSHERISSPPAKKKDHEKATDDRRRKDGERDLDRDSRRNQSDRGGNSYKHSERQSSRSSHGYHRQDDYRRRDRYGDYGDKDYSRSSRHSDYPRKEKENPSRGYERDYDKYSRDKSERLTDRSSGREKESLSREYQEYRNKDSSSDKVGSGRQHRSSTSEDVKAEEREIYKAKSDNEDKIVLQRSSGDYKHDHSHSHSIEDSRSHIIEPTSMRDSRRDKETNRSDSKSLVDEKYSKQEKYSDEKDKYNERHRREYGEQHDDRGRNYSKDQDNATKKPKLFSSKEALEDSRDVTKEKAVSDRSWSTNPKPAQDPAVKGTSDSSGLTDADVDAAKVAAMKAAELVNRNLIGTGLMSADQKKKLLWGNKKTAATEESGHRWDTTMLGDPERQEKFQKLMSLRLHWYLLPNVGCEGRERQSRKQGGGGPEHGEAEGGATPVGLGEAIHCWPASPRRSHCWTRSLNLLGMMCLCECNWAVFSITLSYYHFASVFLHYFCYLISGPVYNLLSCTSIILHKKINNFRLLFNLLIVKF